MQYKYIKNFLDSKLCEKIINTYNNDSFLRDAMTDSPTEENFLNYSFNKRKMNVYQDNTSVELLEVSNQLSTYLDSEIKIITLKNKNISYTFNKYVVGDFLNYHSDLSAIKNGALYTFVLELNIDYDGGEFVFINENGNEVVNEKSIGGLFIFDSYIKHKVNPVKHGTRFSLNCWPSLNKKRILI